mmetsp:Transcript_15582/g.31276  ORF Transcript_15582/g.31276 Transcript_15582/m.31276 type:complete len:242 (+) Transcript_15582:736-1461(+)
MASSLPPNPSARACAASQPSAAASYSPAVSRATTTESSQRATACGWSTATCTKACLRSSADAPLNCLARSRRPTALRYVSMDTRRCESLRSSPSLANSSHAATMRSPPRAGSSASTARAALVSASAAPSMRLSIRCKFEAFSYRDAAESNWFRSRASIAALSRCLAAMKYESKFSCASAALTNASIARGGARPTRKAVAAFSYSAAAASQSGFQRDSRPVFRHLPAASRLASASAIFRASM